MEKINDNFKLCYEKISEESNIKRLCEISNLIKNERFEYKKQIENYKYTLEDIMAINETIFTLENPMTYKLYLQYNEWNLSIKEKQITENIIAKLENNKEFFRQPFVKYM